ncbi:microtubule-associated protein 70-1-like [Andrographis paniculata]|uniref:microtubule-associated protein 70-1-like n=1 Tax=Andrographis paniculata TaxID=175694 RepID=UPI0021E97781|nr:microtubule-associated protein 70-1-like [Andrographis paniculata]
MASSFHNFVNGEELESQKLPSLPSFKGKKKPRAGAEVDDFITLMHGSDPVRVELARLENEIREKNRDVAGLHGEIKALKYEQRLKEKAVQELTNELKKVDEKFKVTEAQLESKNLEIKKINEEKKAAVAAQFAAEATLRRVHAAQKDNEMPPIEAIIAPLEAELKLARIEKATLMEDNRALDRLTKSKELALLEAERAVKMALAKASLMDDLQNKNQEFMKQIGICQEENRILDRMHRQKVVEVERLTQTVRELEEAVLSGGAAANAVRNYERKVQEINEEKRILDRELARAKVSVNRVAVVVANEWKDANDKVMPVKQWLEERKFFQGEIQQLKDKLAIVERAAKAEAKLKEKYLLRFKVLEERLKTSPLQSLSQGRRSVSNSASRRSSHGEPDEFISRNVLASSWTSSRTDTSSSLLKHTRNLSVTFNGTGRLSNRDIVASQKHKKEIQIKSITSSINNAGSDFMTDKSKKENEDYVSGVLYDMLQKEVLKLQKACQEKDESLKDKDGAIEMLAKKVETLNKAIEVEAKKMRREVNSMEREVAALRNDKEQLRRNSRSSVTRGTIPGSHTRLMRSGQYP